MQIALIRHLPTIWNQKGLLQGTKDISILPIRQKVKEEIVHNKRQLKKFEPVELVLTSTLTRTQETAKAYGYNEYTIEPLLDELNFGKFEGKEKSLLIKECGNTWIKSPRDLNLGESLVGFEQRILTFLSKYKNHSRILIFGHGSWIRGIISITKVRSIDDMNTFHLDNNSLTLLDFSETTSYATGMHEGRQSIGRFINL